MSKFDQNRPDSLLINISDYLKTDEVLFVKEIVGRNDLNDSLKIREIVFINEQNVSVEDEMIPSEDEISTAFLINFNNCVIGTIRFMEEGNNQFKVGRFAILKEYRGHGFGKAALKFLVDFIKQNYINPSVYMNAQYYLKDYYASCGFKEVGEPFDEAGIKHIKMVLKN